jgi:peptide deformylase
MKTSILEWPDNRLTTICPDIMRMDVNQLFRLIQTMHANNGYGLAGPQIGWMARVFVVQWGEIFVNPDVIYMTQEGKNWAPESCLSLPGQTFMVERYNVIRVDGKVYTGLHARVIQHEQDHLNGILISAFGIRPEEFETAKPSNTVLAGQ